MKNEVPEWLAKSPVFTNAQKERALELLTERKAAVERLKALQVKLADETAAFRKTDAQLAARVESAREALKAAVRSRSQAYSEHRRKAIASEWAQKRERGLLIDGADPAIGAFIADMNAALEGDRRSVFTALRSEPAAFSGRIITAVRTNTKSFETRKRAIRSAIEAAEQLQIEACEDLPAQLRTLRDSIPPLETELTEVQPYRATA